MLPPTWFGMVKHYFPLYSFFPPWGSFSPIGIVLHAPWNLQSSVSSWWPWASPPSSLHALLLVIPEYNGVLLQVFLRSGIWLPWLLHEQHRRKLLVVHVRWKSTAPSSLGKLLSYVEVYLHIPKFHSLLHEGVAFVDCISFKVNMLHHVLQDFMVIMITCQGHDHLRALEERLIKGRHLQL